MTPTDRIRDRAAELAREHVDETAVAHLVGRVAYKVRHGRFVSECMADVLAALHHAFAMGYEARAKEGP